MAVTLAGDVITGGFASHGVMIAIVGYTLLTLDLFDSLLGGEYDELMEGRWNCPHLMDPSLPRTML